MKKNKKILFSGLIIFLSFLLLSFPGKVSAGDGPGTACAAAGGACVDRPMCFSSEISKGLQDCGNYFKTGSYPNGWLRASCCQNISSTGAGSGPCPNGSYLGTSCTTSSGGAGTCSDIGVCSAANTGGGAGSSNCSGTCQSDCGWFNKPSLDPDEYCSGGQTCCVDIPHSGGQVCTDPSADNYNSIGSCIYAPGAGGNNNGTCTDPAADNYGSSGSCVYAPGAGGAGGSTCNDWSACNYGSAGACDYSCLSVSGTGTGTGSGTGAGTTSGSGIYIPTGAETGLPEPAGGVEGVVKNILNWMLGIVGVIAIIGFIISGFQYLVSAGSEKTIETAKRNITYSIIGVIVALSGLIIIKAVDAALRASSTTF